MESGYSPLFMVGNTVVISSSVSRRLRSSGVSCGVFAFDGLYGIVLLRFFLPNNAAMMTPIPIPIATSITTM